MKAFLNKCHSRNTRWKRALDLFYFMMDNQTHLNLPCSLNPNQDFLRENNTNCCFVPPSRGWLLPAEPELSSEPENITTPELETEEAWRIAPHSSSPGPGLNLTSSPFGNLLMSLQFNDENGSQYSFRISSKRSCSIEDWSSFGPSYPLFLYNFRRLVNAELKASTYESYETKIRMHQNGITRARGECRIDEWA